MNLTKMTPGQDPNKFASTRFRLSVENEQAGAGRKGRNRLAISNSQVQTGTGKYYFSLFS